MHQFSLLKGHKSRQETLVSEFFPVLCERFSRSKFQHSNLSWKEFCSQMANLVADLEVIKANFTPRERRMLYPD